MISDNKQLSCINQKNLPRQRYHSDNGLSIIKSQVVNYLKQHPQVLGLCSCSSDGWNGAVFASKKSLFS